MESTTVRIFGKPQLVYGYGEEGWFNILRQTGEYNEFNLENLRQFIKPDSVCIDAGANLGMMTLAMAELAPKGRVYAYEPDPKTFAALIETIQASSHHNIMAFQQSLGLAGVKGTFVEDPAWRSSSHFLPNGGFDVTDSIDSMELPHVDFIKIDVEGCELDVLEGARETLESCKPTVVMEFNSFAFIHYRDILPRAALKQIFSIFPWVGYFEKRVGKLFELNEPETFLRNNLLGGFVDDLVCRWT